MKKRIVFLVLAFACLSGSLVAQTLYDHLREEMLKEKLTPIDKLIADFNLNNLPGIQATELQKKLSLTDTQIELLAAHFNNLRESISIEISKVKFKKLTFGGQIDLLGEKGTTYGINSEFSIEVIKIKKTLAILPVISAAIKRNDEITAFELTGGFRIDGPLLKNFIYPYCKGGIGLKSSGGDKPDSFIFKGGPGFGLLLWPKFKWVLEFDWMFYGASKSIYSDGAIKKKTDSIINISISFPFQ